MEEVIKYNMFYCSQKGLNFSCGALHCWEIKEGYQTAYLQMDGQYIHHQKFIKLEDAILRLRKG